MSNITNRIKTFQDACRELGEEHSMVQAYNNMSRHCGATEADILAYLKLRIITAALNEGWRPKGTPDERRYSLRFYFYTPAEVEKKSDEWKRCNGPLFMPAEQSPAHVGWAYVVSCDIDTGANYHYPAGLCFKSEEPAMYCAKQFTDLWIDFYTQ